MSYREYFDIDPEYFPQVDKKIIEEQPDLWKKFYPHPTFIKLLKSMVDVLSRKQKLSVWVDGAYGTGKSHSLRLQTRKQTHTLSVIILIIFFVKN